MEKQWIKVIFPQNYIRKHGNYQRVERELKWIKIFFELGVTMSY